MYLVATVVSMYCTVIGFQFDVKCIALLGSVGTETTPVQMASSPEAVSKPYPPLCGTLCTSSRVLAHVHYTLTELLSSREICSV